MKGNKQSNATSSRPNDNGIMKNAVYESVCSPEDVAERTKVAQRHLMRNCNESNNILGSDSSSVSSNTNNSSPISGNVLNNVRNQVSPASSDEMKSKCSR